MIVFNLINKFFEVTYNKICIVFIYIKLFFYTYTLLIISINYNIVLIILYYIFYFIHNIHICMIHLPTSIIKSRIGFIMIPILLIPTFINYYGIFLIQVNNFLSHDS